MNHAPPSHGSPTPPADPAASNGIDAVDVELGAPDEPGAGPRRVELFVQLFQSMKVEDTPGRDNVRIVALGRNRPLTIVGDPLLVDPSGAGCFDVIRLEVEDPSDGLLYVLSLDEAEGAAPYHGFDPDYASVEFRFRNGCMAEADCGAGAGCMPAPRPESPEIEVDYLAKDYESFRRLILDRLAQTLPDWADREVPDLGITIVEVLAYAADHLSYYQDAVATEAYLGTARRRISLRRHARLVGYPMHDGCNARAWVCIEVDPDPDLDVPLELDPEDLYVFTEPPRAGAGPSARPPIRNSAQLLEDAESDRVVFAPVVPNPSGRSSLRVSPRAVALRHDRPRAPLRLFPRHNKIHFVAEGAGVCLPRGATTASMVGPLPELRVGDVLVFEEVRGPRTELREDADPTHRHAVRLRSVVGGTGPRVEVEWFEDDALPFPLCLRGPTERVVSVARGNVVLVDHGLWRPAEDLRPVITPAGLRLRSDGRTGAYHYQSLSTGPLTQAAPFPDPDVVARVQAGYLADLADRGDDAPFRAAPYRGLPAAALHGAPLDDWRLVQALRRVLAGQVKSQDNGNGNGSSYSNGDGDGPAPHPWDGGAAGEDAREPADPLHPLAYGPASRAIDVSPTAALPALVVRSVQDPHRAWVPRRDLMGPTGGPRAVVAEMDDEGRAHLRFDEAPGATPEAGEVLVAAYRVGVGTAGNVGAGAIVGLVTSLGPVERVTSVRNPLPAAGGTELETAESVRMAAPASFRDEPLRAVTAGDYARRAERDPRVQKAAAALLWTGDGFEARVALDLTAAAQARYGTSVGRIFREVEADLNRVRRIGHDVRVVAARSVPLLVRLRVRLKPGVLAVPVESALRTALGRGLRPDGSRALFHPDNLTFGSSVAASAIEAEALKFTGVVSARVEKLVRLLEDDDPDPPSSQAHNHIDLPKGRVLTLGPWEVPQLDDDPRAPGRGRLILCVEGGR